MATMYLYFGSSIRSVTVHANNNYYPKTFTTSGKTHTLSNLPSSGNIWIVPSNDVEIASGYGTPINITTQNPSGSWKLDNDNYVAIKNGRSMTLTATYGGGGGDPTYTTYGLNLRTGTGINSYSVRYLGSKGSSYNTATVSNPSASTVCWTRANTNLEVTGINYSSSYGNPFYFVEYTNSNFSTVKGTFADNDGEVYSSGTRYVKLFGTKKITYVNALYYKNGGTWSSGSDPYIDTIESGSYSSTYTPSVRVSRTNYHLLGWSTSSTATSATYGTNEAIGPLGGNLTLYAVWQENPYITLDAGEGRFGTERYAYFHIGYGDYVYFSNYTPTRYGYNLIGWSATQGSTSPTYGPSDTVGPLYGSSYKYYAVWQKATATITLNGNGGLWDASTGILTLTKNVGDTLSFSNYASIKRTNYIHLGWSTSKTATSAAWGVNGSVTVGATDATYYAVWEKKTVQPFYWDNNNGSSDGNLIATGKPFSNLTAEMWNRLNKKIKEISEAQNIAYTYTTVNSGSTMTATLFNEARNGIAKLPGRGSIPSEKTKGDTAMAGHFNGVNSIKNGLNTAIQSYNA